MSNTSIDSLAAMVGMMSARLILEMSRDPEERARAQRTLEAAQRALASANELATPTTVSTG